MSKKTNKATVNGTINNAIGTTKKTAKQVNDFALNTTETTVLETISFIGQWQKVADKALKGGFKLMNNQQDLVFNTLETAKGQLIESKNRFSKLFAA